MDPKLWEVIDETMPSFNPTIVEGFHKKEFDQGLQIFERNLRLTFKGIDNKGVYFRGISRVSPRDFIAFLKEASTKPFDIHKETLYPVKLSFDYKDKSGKMIPLKDAYVMLPYCDRHGDIFIRNTQYSLQFVLAERGLSVTKDNKIFIKVLGAKFKIGTEYFRYAQVFSDTGNYTKRTSDINLPASRFYSATEAWKVSSNKVPHPLLAWYTFADMGFSKAMELYGECEYRIGSLDAIAQECRSEQRWEVITLADTRNEKFLGEYVEHDVALAIRNTNPKRLELSTMGLQYACALLYIADCVSSYFEPSQIDEPDYWKLIIGRCSVKANAPELSILKWMHDHFKSMNGFLDEDSIKRFASQSISVTNMFELFNYIIANRSEIIQTTDRADVFHKELASFEFTIDKLIVAANLFKYDILNNSDLNQGKINRFLSKHFRLKEIDSAARAANLIQEATPTDNPFVDYVLGCMSQHKVFGSMGKNKTSKEFNPNDSAVAAHHSIAFVMSSQRPTKPDPDSRGYLAPCIYLIHDRITGLRPERRELAKQMYHRLNFREIK